jgi:uncharacterized iron-regulated membrane protein
MMSDRRGQDLIEYALMAGFVAVAAGAIIAWRRWQNHNNFRKGKQRSRSRRFLTTLMPRSRYPSAGNGNQ